MFAAVNDESLDLRFKLIICSIYSLSSYNIYLNIGKIICNIISMLNLSASYACLYIYIYICLCNV